MIYHEVETTARFEAWVRQKTRLPHSSHALSRPTFF
jgi:hypothetical protein